MVIQRIEIATLPPLQHCVLRAENTFATQVAAHKLYVIGTKKCMQPFSNSASLFVIVHGWSSWTMEYLEYGEFDGLF